MDPIRLIFGVMLLSLCVFGLPEGCLVLASDAAAPPRPICDFEAGTQLSTEWIAQWPHP
jgi:hypothetical protein